MRHGHVTSVRRRRWHGGPREESVTDHLLLLLANARPECPLYSRTGGLVRVLQPPPTLTGFSLGLPCLSVSPPVILFVLILAVVGHYG